MNKNFAWSTMEYLLAFVGRCMDLSLALLSVMTFTVTMERSKYTIHLQMGIL